ncbi:MAG: kelch repeat-containing protein, partial [Acidobacteriota bacterium]|nr:kelch repeat-containing protein [Acidobacteriota bacterium]
AKLSFPRYKHDAVALKDGRVLIYGGSDARDLAGRLNTAEVFDPRKKSFERVGDLKNARYKVTGTAVVLGDGRVLIAGGAERAELFDPKSGQFSLVEGSYGHTYHFASATLLDDGRALIIGGYRFRSGQGPLATNSAWIFGNG